MPVIVAKAQQNNLLKSRAEEYETTAQLARQDVRRNTH